jgi:hypothetical protein
VLSPYTQFVTQSEVTIRTSVSLTLSHLGERETEERERERERERDAYIYMYIHTYIHTYVCMYACIASNVFSAPRSWRVEYFPAFQVNSLDVVE